jgi:cephalosporin hydroxylase
MALVDPEVRARIEYVAAPGAFSPRPVELLYIDSTHDRADALREFEAWRPMLRGGAMVVFDDYAHPEFPGVREAVGQLGLDGWEQDGLFVHRVA